MYISVTPKYFQVYHKDYIQIFKIKGGFSLMWNYTLSHVLLSIIIMSIFSEVIHYRNKKLFEEYMLNADVHEDNVQPSSDVEEMTEYEKMLVERNKVFDERIRKIKDELANQQPGGRKGVVADILDPNVYNLPHDGVKTKYDLPGYVEVAE